MCLKHVPLSRPDWARTATSAGHWQTCRSFKLAPEKTMQPYIVTAPNGEQTLIYQTRDGRIKAERINPVEPPPRPSRYSDEF